MSYGESLPDQVDRVANLSDAHADIFGDVSIASSSRSYVIVFVRDGSLLTRFENSTASARQ